MKMVKMKMMKMMKMMMMMMKMMMMMMMMMVLERKLMRMMEILVQPPSRDPNSMLAAVIEVDKKSHACSSPLCHNSVASFLYAPHADDHSFQHFSAFGIGTLS